MPKYFFDIAETEPDQAQREGSGFFQAVMTGRESQGDVKSHDGTNPDAEGKAPEIAEESRES